MVTRRPKTTTNLESVREPFDPRTYAQDFGIKFRSFDVPPVPRVWFVNKPGTELIQVQRKRQRNRIYV